MDISNVSLWTEPSPIPTRRLTTTPIVFSIDRPFNTDRRYNRPIVAPIINLYIAVCHTKCYGRSIENTIGVVVNSLHCAIVLDFRIIYYRIADFTMSIVPIVYPLLKSFVNSLNETFLVSAFILSQTPQRGIELLDKLDADTLKAHIH